MQRLSLCFIFIGLCFRLSAQVPGEYLLLLHSLAEEEGFRLRHPDLKLEGLVPDMPLWLGRRAPNSGLNLDLLRRDPAVRLAQANHELKPRSLPNDSLLSLQWSLLNLGGSGHVAGNDIGVSQLWAWTHGGTTALGDTIVIAIIDSGMDSSHRDFEDNLWRNYGEIPNNGLDEDHNGYVDDYLGYNALDQNDRIYSQTDDHGTAIAGLIGAKGNNRRGITGISPKVKLMIIRSNFNTTEAVVLRAYGYALRQRQRYNASQGQSGAYVVGTNSAWGRDFGQASQAPLWCAMYDSLGEAGILNIASTTNFSVNVDVSGDLPSTCPSPYLLTVTNLNRFNALGAGYGQLHVDMGSYGDGTYSTKGGNSYGSFGGTSAASAHVSGGLALLYALACDSFLRTDRDNPGAQALRMKDFLMQGGRFTPSLERRTVSDKRLHLPGSWARLLAWCQGLLAQEALPSTPPLRLYPNPNPLVLDWPGASLPLDYELYNLLGQKLGQGQCQETPCNLDFWPNLEPGLYFLHCREGRGRGQGLQFKQE